MTKNCHTLGKMHISTTIFQNCWSKLMISSWKLSLFWYESYFPIDSNFLQSESDLNNKHQECLFWIQIFWQECLFERNCDGKLGRCGGDEIVNLVEVLEMVLLHQPIPIFEHWEWNLLKEISSVLSFSATC